MRRSVILGCLCLLVCGLMPTHASAQYSAPVESTSVWEVMDDGADVFAILENHSQIMIYVRGVGETTIQTTMTVTPQVYTLDSFIRYDSESMCIPFFISTSLLVEENQNMVDQHNETWFGSSRLTSMISFTHVKIQDDFYTDWELSYDSSTGILLRWIMRDFEGKETVVQLTQTDAWGDTIIPTSNSVVWWWVLGIAIGVAGLGIGIYFVMKGKKRTPLVSPPMSVLMKKRRLR